VDERKLAFLDEPLPDERAADLGAVPLQLGVERTATTS